MGHVEWFKIMKADYPAFRQAVERFQAAYRLGSLHPEYRDGLRKGWLILMENNGLEDEYAADLWTKFITEG